jgi:hypothetical protein
LAGSRHVQCEDGHESLRSRIGVTPIKCGAISNPGDQPSLHLHKPVLHEIQIPNVECRNNVDIEVVLLIVDRLVAVEFPAQSSYCPIASVESIGVVQVVDQIEALNTNANQ